MRGTPNNPLVPRNVSAHKNQPKELITHNDRGYCNSPPVLSVAPACSGGHPATLGQTECPYGVARPRVNPITAHRAQSIVHVSSYKHCWHRSPISGPRPTSDLKLSSEEWSQTTLPSHRSSGSQGPMRSL